MKTSIQLKLVLLCIGTLFTLQSLKASNGFNEGPKKTETEKTIQHYFKFPQILMPQLAPTKNEVVKVEVLYTTNAKGEVTFALAKTENQELKKEIESQFLKLKIKQVQTEVVNSVILQFRSIWFFTTQTCQA